MDLLFPSGFKYPPNFHIPSPTGQDIFRALALGANACMIGRPFLYGLGAAGEAGVARALSIFRGELDTTMILAGLDDVTKIDHHAIASELPGEFAARN